MTKILRLETLLKRRLQHSCFPVNYVNFLGTLFLYNTSGGCFCIMQSICRQQRTLKIKHKIIERILKGFIFYEINCQIIALLKLYFSLLFITLTRLIFADFAEFSPLRENLSPRRFWNSSIRENKSTQNFCKKI